ncbi:N-acetylmuramoyl-L-alanine amidase [Stackebrandtia soli]|uniref:N-acetylmuramoyl-L-alanine amidase n=1 Tax=Stackebrandtia soli TaxID=1892856 RepID=UPI0039EC1DCE
MSRRRALFIAAGGLAAVPLLGIGRALAEPTISALPRVYIDPGHGGTDPGAVGNGLQEKALTLAIALGVRDHLNANWDVDIRMSRTTDISRTLAYRSSDANSWGADLFVSVHINSGGGTGFESYRYTTASAGSVALQNAMHPQILAGMRSVGSVTDRGKKSANFHVLRETSMPAILTETLFIDRAADAALLKNSAFLKATAIGHAKGIAQYLGLGGGTPDPTPTWPTLRQGSTGENVRTLQYLLRQRGQTVVVDGSFGPATDTAVRALQTSLNLTVDGVVGPKTWAVTVLTRRNGDTGEAVKGIQRSLSSKHGIATTVDGSFGPGTDTSVRTFQSRKKLTVDGVVGPITWQALLG